MLLNMCVVWLCQLLCCTEICPINTWHTLKISPVFDIRVLEVPSELHCLFITNKSLKDCIRSPHILSF